MRIYFGSRMVVNATSSDLDSGHFGTRILGGGLGIFDCCTNEFVFQFLGTRCGGVSSRSECPALPAKLQGGCQWRRLDWFMTADNRSLSFSQA
ncbi:glycoside hydrolase [Colletotrichum caudatum]|nr:glycoside hydrolase [Colletotrichum caudatum]